jgi:hypothetical protein
MIHFVTRLTSTPKLPAYGSARTFRFDRAIASAGLIAALPLNSVSRTRPLGTLGQASNI